ncbi:carbohydrate-binding module family 50 protein [Laccaria amethystina LaAM-08-1]|uniref:Carbohydrate-binding module family 50 protein n=1 Tax=Laccaria amethystina LaAM-08-1 TaxID=1095629 RepID=A0A0C9WJ47_9AGAR|nr:carbohydrate-binding module family 50 protein [Laccaria amethystina LaAM-08-1]
MFSQVFAGAFVAVLVAQSAVAGCARTYTVQEGDYCDKISAANNVSTYQLAVVNRSIDPGCGNLLPGQTLCLGNTGEDCSETHQVQADDTCERIIANHGLNSTLLFSNNPQIHQACENIYIGEVLCIAEAVHAPPAPAVPVTILPGTKGATSKPTTPAVLAAPSTPTPTHAPASGNTPAADDDDLPYCDEL